MFEAMLNDNKDLEVLEGEVLEEILLSPNKRRIQFVCKDGSYEFFADGGCCSVTYFQDLTGVESVLDEEIKNVEHKGMTDTEESGRYQVNKYYGHDFESRKGRMTLVYRNESNGYYGGWLDKTSVTEDTSDWKSIMSDFGS